MSFCRPPFEQFAVPVSFRLLDIESVAFELATDTISIFNQGFTITSPRKLRIGSLLLLRLRIPNDKPDTGYRSAYCSGRVVADQSTSDVGPRYKIELVSSTFTNMV